MSTFLQIVAWTPLVFWQPQPVMARDWYKQRKDQIMGAPPGWLFGVAWSIIYILIIAAAVTFFGNSDQFVAAFVLYLINLVLNKSWAPLFFDAGALGLAAWVVVGMIGTQIAILVLMGIEEAWTSFGLYIPYLLWCVYALYLNVEFWRLEPLSVQVKYRVRR